MTGLIDTHCHIDFADFDVDRQMVIRNALKLGIEQIIVPATTQATWQRTITTCRQHKPLHLALGLHPVFIQEHKTQHLKELEQLIAQEKPIAVGEIGLDFYNKEQRASWPQQLAFFEQQLELAKQYELPVIIHNRKAHDNCIKLLKQHQVKGGIIHAFNGSLQQAYHYIDLGFLLGFGGMLTYTRSRKLHALFKTLPLESIVAETDAPDMTVSQHQGERNSPEFLTYVLNAMMDIKKLSKEEIASTLHKNVNKLFKLSQI